MTLSPWNITQRVHEFAAASSERAHNRHPINIYEIKESNKVLE
jgi:hypothetical protein